jgi:DNA-directed RNA polymerase subunit RPC12/RpoP
MFSFFCKKCNSISYSSSHIRYQNTNRCPYCNAEGLVELSDFRIGEIMVALGYIDRNTLKKCLELQKSVQKMLGQMFIENHYINPDELNHILKIQREAA